MSDRGQRLGTRRRRTGTLLGAAAVATALAAAAPAAAQSRFAIGADLGTSGAGAELAFQFSPKFVGRLDADYFKYDGDIKGQVVTYNGSLKLETAGLFVDFHPFANPWLVSGGAYMGTRSAEARPTLQAVGNRIGGDVFTADEIGILQGKLKLDDFAPFIGVGWNNTFYNEHWGFKAMVGAVFSNEPRVELSRTGGTPLPAPVQARLDVALRAEEERLSSNTDILKIYPVVQVGVAYRF